MSMAVFGKDIKAAALHIENDDGAINKIEFDSASIDTRSMTDGGVFFAIRGEQRNGHDFVIDASNKAGIVVVDEKWWNETGSQQRNAIRSRVAVVNDTVEALGSIARLHRRRYSIPMLAVTGSSGKTTTKDMIVQTLEKKYNVHSTRGNFNNHLGLPLTLFALNKSHEVSVVEIGMNHPGEIEKLCSIAEPTHGIVTNIGKGHLGYFDSIKDVAREKGMLYRWIEKDSKRTAFVNADDERVVSQSRTLSNTVRYGFDRDDVDVRGSVLNIDETGRYTMSFRRREGSEHYTMHLPVSGQHQAANALAAVAVSMHFGVTPGAICNALQEFVPPEKRNVIKKCNGITIVDDTYNANPDSMQAVMQMFSIMNVPGKKILILGDMLELGNKSGEEHGRIGLLVPEMGFEYVFTFGEESEALYAASSVPFGGHYDNKELLVHDVLRHLEDGDAILVKGSRGMRMEEIIQMIEEKYKR